MAITFDSEQRAAVSVRANAVVMAGAGSGKTSVLAERFVWLLRERGARVEEVLALTFTQKAAAEMFERIHRRLSQEGEAGLESLRAFDRAQISTLDAFCAGIARDAAGSFGLPPRFASDEEQVARLAEELALEFLLARWREPNLAPLLRLWDFRTLQRELFAELAVRHFHLAGGESLELAAERQLAECRAAAARLWAEAGEACAGLAGLPPRTQTIRANQEAARLLSPLGGLLEQERWQEAGSLLAACRLRKTAARAVDLERMNAWVEALRGRLPALGELCAALAGADTLRGAFAELELFRQRFLQAKRAAGLVTFRDVAEMAVAALLADPALRRHYKARFRFILIDEFQDNNRLQKELLYLLAERAELCAQRIPRPEELEPDKLFFVGDEKQSIYRFRGADVSVFAALAGELERSGGQGLALDRNYRSAPGLVGFFNDLFARVFHGAQRDFEARYRPLASPYAAAAFRPQVRLLLQPQRPAGEPGELAGPQEAEAWAVARLIRERVRRADLPVQDERGEVRPAGFADFAVLLRSTGNQAQFERMFRRLGVPYSTPDLRGLFLEAPASDLYQLLRLALHPGDRAAYAGLLRSPLVNLSDEGLLELLLAGGRPFARLEPLGPEDRRRAERGRELVGFVRAHADRLGHGELLHRLWNEEGYRCHLLADPRTHNHLEFYDYLLELAERAEARGDTLAAFTAELGRNLGQFRRLEELEVLPSRRAAGVQLLTIHKAKGLEFPVVVLADMGNRGRTGAEKRPYYPSEDFGITLNLGKGNWFTRVGERETAARELAEARRLLYVALTRARSHLILSGTLKRSRGGAHLDMLLSGLGLDAERPLSAQLPQPAPEGGSAGRGHGYDLRVEEIPELPLSAVRAGPSAPAAPDLPRLASWYELPPLSRPAVRREFGAAEIAEALEQGRLPGFPALGGPARELPATPVDGLLSELGLEAGFGTRTHELLQLWLEQPAGPPPQADWRGLATAHRAACQQAAAGLARRFLDSGLGRLAAAAATREVEVPFVYRWQGAGPPLYVSGKVDLAFEAAEGVYLVDFKTDRSYREGGYEAQLGLYALAWGQWGNRPVLPVIFLLRSGQALPVRRQPDWPAVFAALPR